jgi:hypothetical protein
MPNSNAALTTFFCTTNICFNTFHPEVILKRLMHVAICRRMVWYNHYSDKGAFKRSKNRVPPIKTCWYPGVILVGKLLLHLELFYHITEYMTGAFISDHLCKMFFAIPLPKNELFRRLLRLRLVMAWIIDYLLPCNWSCGNNISLCFFRK